MTRFRLNIDQRVRLNKNCRQVLRWKHRTTPSTSTEWGGEEAPWKSRAISCLLPASEKWYQCRTSHGKVEHRREGSGTGTVICFSLEQLYLFIPFWIGSHIFILTKHTYFFYSEYLLQFWARLLIIWSFIIIDLYVVVCTDVVTEWKFVTLYKQSVEYQRICCIHFLMSAND